MGYFYELFHLLGALQNLLVCQNLGGVSFYKVLNKSFGRRDKPSMVQQRMAVLFQKQAYLDFFFSLAISTVKVKRAFSGLSH